MRKNTARHWLHAALDLLPVILIPVFMIYSHRHDLSTDITIQQDVYKDFYQGVKNGKPNENLDNIIIDDISSFPYQFDDGYLRIDVGSNALDLTFQCEEINLNLNDIIYFSVNLYNITQDNFVEIYIDNEDVFYQNFILPTSPSLFSYYLINTAQDNFIERINFYTESDDEFLIKDVQLFNLTTIFGSGNEPTKEVFESYLTQDYYDFGSNQVKVGTIDVQAKNNDIMSVFMDSFNNSVNKYFNMGNVFNLNNVYEWFNANLFGGNAPVVIYSVYNIVVYELVMDLLFLLYALFMWFIDMLKRLIEKPLDSIK